MLELLKENWKVILLIIILAALLLAAFLRKINQAIAEALKDARK